MESMSRSELQSLDNEMLLRWLTFLSRYRAEDIGLHVGSDGKWIFGEARPSLEDVLDELVRRGLDSSPPFYAAVAAREGIHEDESDYKRGLRGS